MGGDEGGGGLKGAKEGELGGSRGTLRGGVGVDDGNRGGRRLNALPSMDDNGRAAGISTVRDLCGCGVPRSGLEKPSSSSK